MASTEEPSLLTPQPATVMGLWSLMPGSGRQIVRKWWRSASVLSLHIARSLSKVLGL